MTEAKKIKHIILDVDGVVLGTKPEINFPYPSLKVIEKINALHRKGQRISLCTGKPSFSANILLKMMPLDNLHITDGGAVIFNPFKNKYVKKSIIPNPIVESILRIPLEIQESWQVYTLESKFMQKNLVNPDTLEDSRIMPWEGVDDLITQAANSEVTKLELIFPPEIESSLKESLEKIGNEISIQWTHTPLMLPNKIVIITLAGTDKKSSVDKLLKYYSVDFDEVLTIGDTMSDWKFMDGCKYVATLENANAEMKKMIEDNNGFIGGHVDNDGLVDILEFYEKQNMFDY